MHWEKKICIRITLRRIVGALLMASMAVNLVIVGAVFEADSAQAASTITSTWTAHPLTVTFQVFTATDGRTPTASQTETPTQTATPTSTATPTTTNTNPPTATLCVKRSDWPVYWVERGDTLYSIAAATGSTVLILMGANCLVSTVIYPGQPLHVPRLPVKPTNTYTPTSPTDAPTGFDVPASMTCNPPYYAAFSVSVSDPDGIQSVTALLYQKDNSLIVEVPMQLVGSSYSGSATLPGLSTVWDVDHYQFRAIDGRQRFSDSRIYTERSRTCLGTTPTIETAPVPIN